MNETEKLIGTISEGEVLREMERFRAEEAPRLWQLGDYYRGAHRILRESKDPGKPDNRLVNNFCRAITDCTVGYFMGQPVTYTAASEAEEAVLLRISAASDEAFVNASLARDLSIYGRAAELVWLDADSGLPRFSPVDPCGIIPLWNDSVTGELRGVIRTRRRGAPADWQGSSRNLFRAGRQDKTIVEVYDGATVTEYELTRGGLRYLSCRAHGVGCVPVNLYRNNRDAGGDFEPVLTLVDAYNRLESESINDFELFADSYLAISGMGGTRPEDLEKLRRERVLLLDEGGEARWLTKTVNDGYIENLKSRIARDIYRFSGTVDLSDELASGQNLSGTAIRYRLMSFDNRVRATEQFFRRGLARRWAMIAHLLSLCGISLDAGAIRPTFSRNLPGNFGEAAELCERLKGIVSTETLLSLLPFVHDPEAELARIEAEKAGDPA